MITMEGSTASYEYDDDADASHDLFHPDFATTDDATRTDTKEECDEQVDASISETKYNPNKPKWWKNLSRAPTKGQKKAMNDVLTDHRLPRIPYGTFLDWNKKGYPLCAQISSLHRFSTCHNASFAINVIFMLLLLILLL